VNLKLKISKSDSQKVILKLKISKSDSQKVNLKFFKISNFLKSQIFLNLKFFKIAENIKIFTTQHLAAYAFKVKLRPVTNISDVISALPTKIDSWREKPVNVGFFKVPRYNTRLCLNYQDRVYRNIFINL